MAAIADASLKKLTQIRKAVTTRVVSELDLERLVHRRRAEQALASVIAQAYVEGVSTRRVQDLVEAMGIAGISPSQVSRLAGELDAKVAELYATGHAISVSTHFEVDDVIDPADSRAWISAGLSTHVPEVPRRAKKLPYVDPW